VDPHYDGIFFIVDVVYFLLFKSGKTLYFILKQLILFFLKNQINVGGLLHTDFKFIQKIFWE
jgi:hypothetical protein